MVEKNQLLKFLKQELNLEHFKEIEDAKFNGALVEGRQEVDKVGLCANTTFENIKTAKDKNLDFVISHHGGWKSFDQDLLEEKKQELREANITWYIAHETLDCAKNFGISWTLAEKLDINVENQYAEHAGGKVGVYGELASTKEEFLEKLKDLEPEYEVVGELDELEKKKIGVIGGGGGAFTPLIRKTAEQECDVLVVGSCSFFGKIYAFEKDVTMIVMSETSSERWGIYALGEKLREEFKDLKLHKMKERNW